MGDIDFIDGVNSSANRSSVDAFVFIDPADIDATDKYGSANMKLVREALEDSLPNFTIRDFVAFERVSKDIIDSVLESAPAAKRLFVPSGSGTSKVCLVVTQPPEHDSKEEFAQLLSGIRVGRLKPVPGTDAVWDRAVGQHEGKHCNQVSSSFSNLKDGLRSEAGADLEALKGLRDSGQRDAAQALVDYRVLSAVHSPSAGHATGVALIAGDLSKVTDDYVRAAEQMRSKVLDAVSNEHGLGSERNALRMVEYNPGRFIRTVERALDRGEFRAAGMSPDLEDHVKAYIQAFRRQVDGITPPVPSGARASVDLENGTTSTLTIGGVTAPEFFASIADQASVQTISNNDSAIVENALNASGELSDQVRAVGMKVA